MNNDNKWPIPKYAIIPAAVYILMVPTYFVSHLLTKDAPHISIATAFDEAIPFVPAFIWIYVLAYLQWFVGYVAIAKSSETLCKDYFGGEIIAKAITILVFLIIPTTITQPNPTGSGLTYEVVRWIYGVDNPTNLFPSIHCLESWIVARGLAKTNAPKYTKTAMWLFSVLVFMSVVFVKQHFVLDILGGIAVAELGLFLARTLNFRKVYDALETKLHLG